MSADPPHPIPPFLYPLDVPLGPEDLVFVATRDELAAITEMLTSLDLTNAILRLVHRDGSPWIEFTTVPIDRTARAWDEHVAARAIHRPLRFALWRYTLAVYRIGSDGAVEDDPIWTPERA